MGVGIMGVVGVVGVVSVVGRAASGLLPGKKLCGRDTPEGIFSRDYSTPGSSPVQEPAPPGVTSHPDHWQAPAR